MAPMVAAAVMAGVTAITSIAKSSNNRKLAREQMKRQGELRADAMKLRAPKVSPAYLEAEKMREIGLMKGLPGYKQYEEGISGNMADLAAKGKQAALSGGDYLAFLSGLYGQENQAVRNLQTSDANYRANSLNQLIGMKTIIGQEQSRNEAIKRQQQDELYKQANDLETAATANKTNADNQLVSGITGAFTGILGGAAGSPSAANGEYSSVFGKDNAVDGLTNAASGAVAGGADMPTQFGNQDYLQNGINPAMTSYTNDEGIMVTPEEEGGAMTILKEIGLEPTGSMRDVKSIQGFLKGMGYYTGSVDGRYGPITKDAMSKYLSMKGQEYAPQDLNSYLGQSFVRPR